MRQITEELISKSFKLVGASRDLENKFMSHQAIMKKELSNN